MRRLGLRFRVLAEIHDLESSWRDHERVRLRDHPGEEVATHPVVVEKAPVLVGPLIEKLDRE